jgi:predicted nucleotide-binding protein
VSRKEADEKLTNQIVKGEELASRTLSQQDDVKRLEADLKTWVEFTTHLLGSIFNSDSFANEFAKFIGRMYHPQMTAFDRWKQEQRDVLERLRRLNSIKMRLEMIPEPASRANSREVEPRHTGRETSASSSREIFVVHGHDEASMHAVARFLDKLDIQPVILHEKPDRGRTVIEKFEAHADVGFAVALLTQDDVGGPASAPEKLNPRARQNVIFELGYFFGKLGRARVCALYQEGVELPSDIHGVIYVPYDSAGSWKLRLAKEIKAAGFVVDLNKAV